MITWSICSLVSPASSIACSNGLRQPLEEVGRHLLELRPAQLLVEVERSVGGGRDEGGRFDLGSGCNLRQLDLRLLGGLPFRRCTSMLSLLRGRPVSPILNDSVSSR